MKHPMGMENWSDFVMIFNFLCEVTENEQNHQRKFIIDVGIDSKQKIKLVKSL